MPKPEPKSLERCRECIDQLHKDDHCSNIAEPKRVKVSVHSDHDRAEELDVSPKRCNQVQKSIVHIEDAEDTYDDNCHML